MESDILPADIMTRLPGASHAQVQELARSKIEEYQTQIGHLQGYIHRLKTIYNSSSVLHAKMPPEVLIHIFCNVNPTSLRDVRLTHVCRTWRTLIHRTPEFWRNIVLTLDFGRTNWQIANQLIARTAPQGFGLHFHQAQYLVFLTSNQSSARLSSLKVFIRHQRDLALLLQHDLPSLESLAVESRSHMEISLGLTTAIHRKEFPRLRSLSTTRCPYLLAALSLHSLRHVTLSQASLTPNSLVERLRECPDLQSLTLDNCHTLGDVVMPRLPPVDLPKLRSLYLNGSSIEAPFFSCIIFPQTTYIEITRGRADMSIPEPHLAFPDSLPAITSHLTRVVVSATTKAPLQMLSLAGYHSNSQHRLLIQLENSELDLSAPDSGWWYAGPNFFHFLPDWFQTTQSIQTLELQLQDETLYLPQVTWESLLESFNCVSLLVIRIESCWEFFNALNAVPAPLALQELRVVHQLKLDEDDHSIIVSAVEHLVVIGSPLKRLAITFQAGRRKTRGRPSQWSTEVLGRLRAAVDEVILQNDD